ncbi:aldose 1-epimerase [Actinotignum urinale]|uniref:Aldose 1-epimerase n=1 Tax=Actinotignum urinale TaxID=190146 RepID=A0AAW9HSM5_9ACTO|nr:aldose 1-epimerase [Actinotignum urinale]MDY5129725.1 aldose 1-epimerase [Actinotignum urinale]MDY5154689.1 aldose 1-epimerase [Actinotignum urinale]MDY5160103.1 aldose 1-epimerase [Actinotignum urinale]
MARTVISLERFDGERAWRLTSPTGATALVAERGATLLSWTTRENRELIDGYDTAEQLRQQLGGKSLIELPWIGPSAQSTYTFEDAEGSLDANGLGDCVRVGSLLFSRERSGDVLVLKAQKPADAEYPWPLDIRVVFALGESNFGDEHISISISARNRGAFTAPIAIGWNPYLQFGNMPSVSKMAAKVMARTRLATDEKGHPAPGDAARTGVTSPVEWSIIGTQEIDSTYTSLIPNNEGVVVTEILDPARDAKIFVTQEPAEAPYVRLWTGDRLDDGARQGLLVSPRSATPDTFFRYDQIGRISVPAGGTKELTATITYQG